MSFVDSFVNVGAELAVENLTPPRKFGMTLMIEGCRMRGAYLACLSDFGGHI